MCFASPAPNSSEYSIVLLAGKARKGNEANGTGSGKGKERFTKGKDTRGKERKGRTGKEIKGKEREGKGQGRKSKEWQRAERKGMFASRARMKCWLFECLCLSGGEKCWIFECFACRA